MAWSLLYPCADLAPRKANQPRGWDAKPRVWEWFPDRRVAEERGDRCPAPVLRDGCPGGPVSCALHHWPESACCSSTTTSWCARPCTTTSSNAAPLSDRKSTRLNSSH